MLVTQIPDERTVDIFFFGIDVPRLLHGTRIDLTGHQIFAQRRIRGAEQHVGGGELVRRRSLGLLERCDRLRQRADRVVIHPHTVGIGRENGVGECLGPRLVKPVRREPKCIVAVGFV